MADIYTPSVTGTRRIMDAFSQGTATGKIPSRRYLDTLIQNELDAAANNAIKTRAFNEQVRQFNVGQQNALDTASANRSASQTGSIANLATTAGMMYLMRPSTPAAPGSAIGYNGNAGNNWYNPYNVKTGNGRITNTTEGFTYPENTSQQFLTNPEEIYSPNISATGPEGYNWNPSVTGAPETVPGPVSVSGPTTYIGPAAAEGAGITATGTTIAPETYAATAAGEDAAFGGAATTSTGSTLSAIATPVGYVAAAEMAKNLWGGPGIDWNEKTQQQKTVNAPATTGLLASIAPWALKGDNGAYKAMADIENTVMAPIDWVFSLF
jgi:hypothetical protein